MLHIVKRKGHKEPFESRKVYASVYAACLSVRVHQQEAELVAAKVAAEVTSWVANKELVDSKDIFDQVKNDLEKYNPDAAYMYRTHRDLS